MISICMVLVVVIGIKHVFGFDFHELADVVDARAIGRVDFG